MKHLGDITKLNGAKIPPVWVITGGSPCQDLSVAGKRAGLAGERSGLFMEQIRVIKEMRQHDRDCGRTGVHVRPRYMVWENVPGAFSSNKGEDFRAVLEEICRVADSNADVPQPPNGKWANAGCIMGDGWSVAWRVHDAQFWGVPQRRRRIALVADFGGQSAPEILFERNGVSGDIAESGEARQGTAGDFEGGAYPPVARSLTRRYDGSPCIDRGPNIVCACFKLGNSEQARSIGFQEERSPMLNAECGGNKPAICYGICSDASNSMKSTNPHSGIYVAETSRTLDLNGGNPACNQGGICIVAREGVSGDIAESGTASEGTAGDTESGTGKTGGGNDVTSTLYAAYGTKWNGNAGAYNGDNFVMNNLPDVARSLTARNDGSPCIDRGPEGDHQNRVTDYTAVAVTTSDMQNTVGTLKARDFKGCEYLNETLSKTCFNGASVRRLTPLECERLQGYPDGWTDIGEWTDRKGKKHRPADSPRYKALGNSIALPQWRYVLGNIAERLPRGAELGSLFDGIGGFPLVWSEINGEEACLWASEIEEFPISVTKRWFPDEV